MIFDSVFQSLHPLNTFEEVSKYRDIAYQDIALNYYTIILSISHCNFTTETEKEEKKNVTHTLT